MRAERAILALLVLIALVAGIAERPTGAAAPHTQAAVPLPSAAPSVSAGPALRLTVGAALPVSWDPGVVALSFEAQLFTTGVAAAQPSLVAAVHALAPAFLRVGANTGDSSGLGAAGLQRLAALSSATGVPVVLGLPFRTATAKQDVTLAKAARAALGDRLLALEIGNEPDGYARHGFRPKGYDIADYTAEQRGYETALRAAGVDAPLWGDDTADPDWLTAQVNERPVAVQTLTPHYYALSACSGGTLRPTDLLTQALHAKELDAAASFANASRNAGVPIVLGETNSAACGGADGVSNVSAAGLWAADFGLLMRQAGVRSLAFHVGLSGCDGYSPLCPVAQGAGWVWRTAPAAVGLEAMEGLPRGQFLAAELAAGGHNLRAYAVRTADGRTALALLDLDPQTAGPVRIGVRTGAVQELRTTDYAGTALTAATVPGGDALTLAPGTLALAYVS